MSVEKEFSQKMVDLYNEQEMCVLAISKVDNYSAGFLSVEGIKIKRETIKAILLARIVEIDILLDKTKLDIINYLQAELNPIPETPIDPVIVPVEEPPVIEEEIK